MSKIVKKKLTENLLETKSATNCQVFGPKKKDTEKNLRDQCFKFRISPKKKK